MFYYPTASYVVPFAIFLLLTEFSRWIPDSLLWLYPLKTVIAGVLLVWWRRGYSEEIHPQFSLLAIVIGLMVFTFWLGLDRYYPLLSEPASINPHALAGPTWTGAVLWISVRLLGAVIVVPVMEELFWRSFLLRYLINPDFKRVELGTFSWSSLAWTVVLFGVEHHQWLAGMVAGLLYTLLLYRTKSLFACILAHAITNLVLGVYVLLTQQWQYW